MRKVTLLVLWVAALFSGCGEPDGESPAPAPSPTPSESEQVELAGSRSCRACHERFYELWAPSHHGTAMQPFTPELGRAAFGSGSDDSVAIGDRIYQYVLDAEGGAVLDRGPDDESRHAIAHLMGGKNVYFLLTPYERGRLQVLPIAYDVAEKRWYDTTASMVRHAVGHPDDPVDWTDPLLTFNAACWSCHVSQLSVNYDAETDSYESAWAEPGINCETCHGSATEHIRVCRAAGEGEVPEDVRIISVKSFRTDQRNDTCAPCHAKAIVLTDDFQPGDAYFDHFDLACLEDLDFYPDGRDLGENYTFTLWRMSPCVQSGRLDCIHCHTSSGRYRFDGENANDACLPCHQEHVENASEHTHHEADGPGSRCVACHMPMTEFARMRRSDHSMRPPAPSLTVEHDSPNACNLCHEDQDAAWADHHVRAWRERDFQAPMLEEARLIAEARESDWSHLPAMLARIVDSEAGEVLRTSLIRLLAACRDPRKVDAFVQALGDESPLVRASAAAGLEGAYRPDVLTRLLQATRDDVRLVRIRAAGALAGLPPGDLPPDLRTPLDRATAELEAALGVRPDSWSSHYNLGNLHEQRGEVKEALAAYRRASRLRPDVVPPWVNAAMIHARLGQMGLAENALRKALAVDVDEPAANYNLGLLLAERGRKKEARGHLERAFEADPSLAGAALNLAALAGADDVDEAARWSGKAYALAPENPRVVWTHAFYLRARGEVAAARAVLERAIEGGATSADVYLLLAELQREADDPKGARATLRRAVQDPRLAPAERQEISHRLQGR